MASPTTGIVPLEHAIHSPAVDLSNPIPKARLAQRTVLITGGASGIGAALSTSLAGHGANIIVGDVNEEQGTALVAKLRQLSSSSHHHFIKLDVTSWVSQFAFFKAAAALSPHRGIDCVIANAGINDPKETEAFELNVPRFSAAKEAPPAPRMRTLRVDLDGVMYTSTLALSYLSENPGSEKCSLTPSAGPRDRHLLLVSSIAGVMALPASSIYSAAKHGVVGLFRALRISAPLLHGVRVNMLCPQYVETPIHGVAGAGMLAGVAKTRMEDVVDAVERLVADRGIIGRALLVGTRGSPEVLQAAGLDSTPFRHRDGAIWDIYGHDFEQADSLLVRVVALLNIASQAKGWVNLASDSLGFLFAFFTSMWGAFWALFRG